MKYCETKEDCVVVDCSCSCSGCGGFSYDDAINKKYTEAWYTKNLCTKSRVCPTECCPRSEIVCENNLCIVKTTD